MPITLDEVRRSLLARDPEFRRLAEEHSRCESQLEAMHGEPYVSSEDLFQESMLKRQKLYLKDRMEIIAARHHQEMLQHH